VFTTKVYQYTIKQYTRGGQWDKLQQPHLGGNLERTMYKGGSETTFTVPQIKGQIFPVETDKTK